MGARENATENNPLSLSVHCSLLSVSMTICVFDDIANIYRNKLCTSERLHCRYNKSVRDLSKTNYRQFDSTSAVENVVPSIVKLDFSRVL